MSDQEFEYDVFLSHASEDTVWCDRLAERLRNAGVRVWFDAWEIKPGHHLLARLNEGLKKSRKMAAVWSGSYFRDDKVWTLAEGFSRQHADVLARERPLIPLLIEDCEPLPTFRNILYVDFRNPDDFDLRVRQLIEALDLPVREFAREEEPGFREHDLDVFRRGHLSYTKGKRFEDEIATLYDLLGFKVKKDFQLSGMQIDLLIEQEVGGLPVQAIVECKDKRITTDERDQILAQQHLVQKEMPACRWIAASSQGFAADTRTALEKAGVVCITYPELLRKLVPLDNYVNGLISEYESWVQDHWHGEDWFIRPDLLTDVTYETRPALAHFAKWLGDSRANQLVILGDLGTGKTTLASFLSYNLAKSFHDDPLRHPAPVLIPLKEVRKEVSLEGIIISHFSRRGLPGINFQRFDYLARLGKIILIFDAFDEMADRVRWEITYSNFRELGRAAELNGKVILTCRTHYFKDRNEQIKLIGQGPSLSEIETELYKELRQRSGAEVVYLQEFNDNQIQAYLQKARPQTAVQDWQKIQDIYNLKDLAQRPLLLDMIVKSLPKLKAGQTINAANLYNVYTSFWIDREEGKGRLLNKTTKLALMLELAWRMWHEEKNAIHYRELTPFVKKLVSDKVMEFGDEEADDIAREMQVATFLKRDEIGDFSFVHRSFMEYFLARKLHECLTDPSRKDTAEAVLNTRRFDRKVIYFLTLLDEKDQVCDLLQRILTCDYSPNVSENALQILYWSGRVRCGMEEKISNPEELRSAITQRIPMAAQLAGANLQEIVLEAANLTEANLSGADLSKANLNHAHLQRANFRKARLVEVRAENVSCVGADIREADLSGALFSGANLAESDFTGASYQAESFIAADLRGVRGLSLAGVFNRQNLQAVVQRGHAFDVYTVAYSPSGELLASGGGDSLIILYRTSDHKLLRVLHGHMSFVTSVHFSPDGQKLASGSLDQTIRVWEIQSGQILRVLQGHTDGVRSVHFSPDGEKLASGGEDHTIRIWDVQSGQLLQVLQGHTNGVRSVHFSPDGKKLASGSEDHTTGIWDVQSGQLLRDFPGYNRQISSILLLPFQGHKSGVRSVQFAPDGGMLASGGDDHTVRLWDVRDSQGLMYALRVFQEHKDGVRSVHFSPDGKRLASGSADHTVRLWDVPSGQLLQELQGHMSEVWSVYFSPDGQRLASGGKDHTIRLWDVPSGQLLHVLKGHSSWVWSVDFTFDGKQLVSGSEDNIISVWNLQSGQRLQVIQGHESGLSSVAFSPDKQKLASGSWDQTIKLWSVQSGQVLQVFQGHTSGVWSIRFSPDGQKLASGSGDKTIRLWDAQSGQLLRVLQGHTHGVRAVCFSPDGQRLASGSWDQTISLWDMQSGQPLQALQGHTDGVNSVDFSPDGKKLVSGSGDKAVRLWETPSGQLLQVFQGHTSGVWAVHFSPDGQKLASGSADQTVRLWDAQSGSCLKVLEGHLGTVVAVRFAPNGKYLVAAGSAGRLQFWDFEKGQPFLYRYAFGPGAWLDLLPDGRFDASPDGMRYLCYTEQGTLNSYTAEELVKEFYDPKAVREVLEKFM